jgi:hypothetical protein
MISRDNVRDPPSLAQLYKRSKALVVWERTAAVGEALHCGCPVMVIPRRGFDHEAVVRGCSGGVVIGWNEAAIEPAREAIGVAIAHYASGAATLDESLHNFVREVHAHFEELPRAGTGALAFIRRAVEEILKRQGR